MQTRDTAPAKEGNIVIITHTAHIGVFSPRLVSELPVIMTRGHEMLAADTIYKTIAFLPRLATMATIAAISWPGDAGNI